MWVAYNQDCGNFYGWHLKHHPNEPMTRQTLAEYFDPSLASCVTHYFINPNGMTASFESDAFECDWKLHGKIECAMSSRYRTHDKIMALKRQLADDKLDPFAFFMERARERGVSPWISMRMNDVHNVHDPSFCSLSTFWLKHPEFRREPGATVRNGGQWTCWALDYSHPEVRAYSLAFVKELLERYDVDGIECDWMRFPEHLPPGRARECSPCLDEFMRDVRREANLAAKRRGHPILVGARVDSDPRAALARGTDPFQWAREGSVDWVVPCNFFATVDFELPYAEWRSRMDEISPQVRIVPGADSGLLVPGKGWNRRLLTRDEYYGWADRLQKQGANGFYLFNLFQHSETGAVWRSILKDGLSQEIIKNRTKSVPAGIARGASLRFFVQEYVPMKIVILMAVGTLPLVSQAAYHGKTGKLPPNSVPGVYGDDGARYYES